MNSKEPIFKPIFGDSWNDLPPVMHKHYANRPFSDDVSTVEGTLDVMCKWYLKPFFWLMGSIPPHNETNVPITVNFTSQSDTSAFCFDRIFHFKNHKSFHFRSRMIQVTGNEVMEQMSYGICWHCYYSWDGRRVVLKHKGYSLQLGNINIALPVTFLIGRGDAYETPVDDSTFDMAVTITHSLLGQMYGYKGRFKVIKEVI